MKRFIVMVTSVLVISGCATVDSVNYSQLSDAELIDYYHQTNSLLTDLENQQTPVTGQQIRIDRSGNVIAQSTISQFDRDFTKQRTQNLRKNLMLIDQEIQQRGLGESLHNKVPNG